MRRVVAVALAFGAVFGARAAPEPKEERLRFSGYVQGRFQQAQSSADGLDAEGRPLVKDGFTVRRGRLKASYNGEHASYVLQIDATPRGVTLKDAEASFTEPWTGAGLKLTVGQTKWPFGYELLQSSGDRELPERSRVVRAFAAGERDRGAKLTAKPGVLRATVGVFDGNGTDDKRFFGVDNDTAKDVIGRVGVDLHWLAFGVSGWWGRSFRPADAASPGGFHPRNRIGADAQLAVGLFPFGKTLVRGELIAGTTYQSGGAELFGQTALGWYGTLVQELGANSQVGVRYDYFDGYTGTRDVPDSAEPSRPAKTNGVGTIGAMASHRLTESLKATVAYEVPLTSPGGPGVREPADNLFTLQLQAKF